MIVRAAATLTLSLALASTAVLAAAPARADVAAERLASAIERRAEKTSFTELQRFGDRATTMGGRESLRRLHHVAVLLLNQSEYASFEHWNRELTQRAQRLGDHRFQVVAQINELKSRDDRGDGTADPGIARIAQTEPDWYARVYAMCVQAAVLMNKDQTGAALKMLSEAERKIPAGDPDAAAAESVVWETIGLSLMDLDDLEGSAKAFQRAEFEFANPVYPRPDFDGVYNMTQMAVQLGEPQLARQFAAIHHRLAERSDLPHLRPWDQNLCGMVAEAFGSPAEVLRCLQGLDARLTGAEFLAPNLLPLRAIAEARRGQVAAARADLARLRTLKASGRFDASSFQRENEVEAELLLAEGKSREAFDALRDYARRRMEINARKVDGGVHQVTESLQTQLATARRDETLQRDAVHAQLWLDGFAALLVFGTGAVLIWQRRVARRLRAAHQKAETASRSNSEFLANMSHEIRTPLNGVVGVADMLLAAQLPKREREMAQIIRDSGRSLERLLSDVLDLARMEAGQIAIEAAPFHAGDLVRAVAALSRLRADEKGLALETVIAPELERWFLGDALRVRQILVNLVSNAVKFTEAGGVTLTAQGLSPGVLRFTVADTGIGFDAEQKARLFVRFQQADGSITRRFGGTGLGLAISHQLAGLMGGTLDCESLPGAGARFWFDGSFPATAAPAGLPQPDQHLETPDDRPVRVLVADDHATNQTVVRMMLEQFGVEAVSVDDGAQAVEAMRRERFDVVLMDMQMPVMDGLTATRLIRQEEAATGRPRTPILMLTANALAEHREAGRLAGADGHVSKPLTVQALLAALNKALETEPERSEAARIARG